MRDLAGRVLVAVPLLVAVLAAAYFDDWWLFAVAAVGAILALHELYTTIRPLRPLVLAGFAGVIAALLGAELGGPGWLLAGLLSTFVFAFGLYGIAETRQSGTVTIASTILGAFWVGAGIGHLILLRDLGDDSIGRLAIFTVLLAVWASDTAAYFAGRLVGRHKLAAVMSPGKTWEGFVAGFAASVLVAFFALYQDRNEFLEDLGGARPRRRARDRGHDRRPVRVGGQARHAGEGHRAPARRARWRPRPDRLAALRFGRRVLHDRGAAGMTRVALLGATGSIGRQALEIIEANPGLELVAAASGTEPIDGLAPLTQVGGDLTELLERAEPDVVLNAVMGFAGLPATLWALERGVTLALANKESLVAAGELALAARERGGGLLLPVDSEHSALFQCLEGRRAEEIDSLVLTASGGPFRGRTREELADVTPEQALRHPTWRMGRKITVDSATLANKGLELIEAHFLFGVAYEKIDVVIHPTSIVHGLARFRDGASLAHLGHPDMRVPISFALTYPERAETPVQRLELAGTTLEFEEPDVETFSLLRLAREAGERGGTFPCVFNAANEVAVEAFLDGRLPFLGIADAVDEALSASDGAPARDLADLVEADASARKVAAGVSA